MRSPEKLRAEVRRLLYEANTTKDVALRQILAAQAFELAQQAEAIANFPDDVEGLRVRIAQYRHMLAGADTEPKQRVVARLLRDAEARLHQINNQPRAPKPHRLAVA